MLGVLCAKPPKPWILSPHTFSLLHHHHHHHHLYQQPPLTSDDPRRIHQPSGGAFIWRVPVPAADGGGDWRRDYLRRPPLQNGEGSWNVAWDARPARWLHRLDFAYLLVGVLLCLSPIDWKEVVNSDGSSEVGNVDCECEEVGGNGGDCVEEESDSPNYRITGVLADGRCLFRAIAHGACLQSGEEAPDENRQRELADELRARVVDEFLKRREEIEWFIEGEFDAYVKRIQEPYVWGGEPELLMASHYLKTPISVFMKDKSTGNLKNIANYGEEYQKEKEFPINVLFHGYGHYDILETSSNPM